MSRIPLFESSAAEFIPDRQALPKALSEALSARTTNPFTPLRIPGRFSLCDSVNGNNRRYPRSVWEKNLKEGSPLMEAVTKRRSIGLLEHPKDGNVSLLSPISHLVTAVKMENQEVFGEITLLNTPEGHKMTALIEAGYNPFVSSRGYGSVITGSDGVDVVQDDFVCESWDLVLNPSFKTAELNPQRESAPSAQPARVAESATPLPKTDETPEQIFARINALVNEGKVKADSVKLVNGTVVLEAAATSTSSTTGTVTVSVTQPASTPAAPVSSATNTRDTMDIKTIRESLNGLRNIDVSKLDPRRLAEGLTQMQNLHRETAAVVAKDPALSYDGRQIDQELESLEQSWHESVKAPAATLTKLQEQQTRTFKVLREACSVGIKTRAKLAEALKSLSKKEGVLAEVAKRGQAWRQRALTAESKLKLSESRLNLSYASLDEFARRYHEDTTKLARGMLMQEHKAKIESDAALLTRVNEATRVEHLLAIKEELAGKKPVTEAAKPAAAAPAAAAPAATPAPAAPAATPAPAAPTLRVESTIRAFTVSELTESTKRLSTASAAIRG